MKTSFTLKKISTFSAAVAIGCGAAIAIAGASASTHEPVPSATPIDARSVAADQIVRLEPVTVTISRARFNALREELNRDTAVARNEENRPLKHG